MGGRGTSSGGKSGHAPKGYRTIGKSDGTSIIKNTNPNGKILPTTAKPNARYLGANKYGKVKQLRIYDKNGNVAKDIDWGHIFDGHPKETVHFHKWENSVRGKDHLPLSPSDILKYKKAIENATGIKDLIWKW